MNEMDDSALEKALMGQRRPERAATLDEAREQAERLMLPGLMRDALSPAEARVEAMNVVGRFERMAAEKILTGMMDGPKEACRTTQHCAWHGWCHQCDPRFAALMSHISVAIQRTCTEQDIWGPLYGRIARVLRGSTEVRLAAELAEAKETQQRLEREMQEMRHRLAGREK